MTVSVYTIAIMICIELAGNSNKEVYSKLEFQGAMHPSFQVQWKAVGWAFGQVTLYFMDEVDTT